MLEDITEDDILDRMRELGIDDPTDLCHVDLLMIHKKKAESYEPNIEDLGSFCRSALDGGKFRLAEDTCQFRLGRLVDFAAEKYVEYVSTLKKTSNQLRNYAIFRILIRKYKEGTPKYNYLKLILDEMKFDRDKVLWMEDVLLAEFYNYYAR